MDEATSWWDNYKIPMYTLLGIVNLGAAVILALMESHEAALWSGLLAVLAFTWAKEETTRLVIKNNTDTLEAVLKTLNFVNEGINRGLAQNGNKGREEESGGQSYN